MRRLFAWLVFVPLQILWLPLTLIGVLLVAYRQIWRSKVLGLSQTAIEIINGRWTAHVFGLRDDPASARLAARLPNTSTTGLALALAPLWVATRIAGAPFLYPRLPDDPEVGMSDFIPARSVRFDALIDAQADRATQFVVLGAGLDARAYGPLAARGLKMFELDRAPVQRAKRAALDAAGMACGHVTFVAVDFTAQDWIAALTATDFDPAQRTVFLWEGVTLYLTEAQVTATLGAIRAIAAPGSVVILDLYGARMLDLARKGMAARTLEATGEALAFHLDLTGDAGARLEAFARAQGFRLGTAHLLGSAHDNGALLAVATLEVPRAGRALSREADDPAP